MAAFGHGYGEQEEHKQLLVVDEYQGKSLQLAVCEEVLAAVTSENRIRLWKLEQREVKPFGLPSGRKVDKVKKILSVRCNCDGTKLSFLAEDDGIEPKIMTIIWTNSSVATVGKTNLFLRTVCSSHVEQYAQSK